MNDREYDASSHFEDDEQEPEIDYTFKEYDLTAMPNDFNVNTIFDFIQSGIMEIPNFQRNYVWGIKGASKLIESIIIGIPIPQIFLYEEKRNKFLVIDGQQRLMTIYYFMKKRFPKKDKRPYIGRIFDEKHEIPDNILEDNEYFDDFNLRLPSNDTNQTNPLDGKNISTLSQEQNFAFGLRTIRNVIIKQNRPPNDKSSIYEIFNRLNSGGVNLTAQEIRSSLYHSEFYEMLYRINQDQRWRNLIELPENINFKDIEILLRGFAMLIVSYEEYRPSMTRFLNKFSEDNQNMPKEDIQYLEKLFNAFLDVCIKLSDNPFISEKGKFNISMFEAIFATICSSAYQNRDLNAISVSNEKIQHLKADEKFYEASYSGTASKANVKIRFERAKEILL